MTFGNHIKFHHENESVEKVSKSTLRFPHIEEI